MRNYIKILLFCALTVLAGVTSCKNEGSAYDARHQAKPEKYADQDKGVELLIAEADLIQVDDNPQYNTAEWLFTVNKPGRFDVWLSSLTCDTLQLSYSDNVIITAGDTRLTKKPVGDEIIRNDKSVREPWYRADSHMGSIFFSQPGEYQIQVISDKVEPHSSDLSKLNIDKHTLINSLILKPMVN